MILAIVLIVLAIILFGSSIFVGSLHLLLWVAIIVLLVGLLLGYRGRSRL